MRGLDTNVLVRYFTADDAGQCAAAERIIEESLRDGEPLFVSAVVMCELVWVLSRVYRETKQQVAGYLKEILGTEQLSIEHDSLMRRALSAWSSGRGDFSDHLIGEISRQAGCRVVVTFDRELRDVPGFTILK